MGGRAETFAGLTGIGDLIVTCASMHSRNRRAGILIGQGRSMEEAMEEVHMVVEGVYSAKAARALAETIPGFHADCGAGKRGSLFDGLPAGEAVAGLMLRDKCTENPSMEWEEG